MPEKDNDLYSRGRYRLAWDRGRDGRLRTPFLQIVWYDQRSRRVKSRSTGTEDEQEAADALDRLYLERERGVAVCHACGQPLRSQSRYLLLDAIADYRVARANRVSFDSIRARLDHVVNYLAQTGRQETYCDEVDEDWIDAFREWAIEVPVAGKAGTWKERSPGTVEGSVSMCAAAINFAFKKRNSLYPAAFTAKKPKDVSNTPSYRANVKVLASMFAFALQINMKTKQPFASRGNLLRFLQFSVATWCRPDAAHDFSTDPKRAQWHPQHQAIALNPKGRAQTSKYRPTIPAVIQIVPLIKERSGYFVGVESVKSAFETMLDEIGLPRDGETGLKLIRRSMASLARNRLGEKDWVEGEIMLGHRPYSATSDIYAPFEPGYLGRAKAVTEQIITEIEAIVPQAYNRTCTGDDLAERRAERARNG